MLHLQHTSLPQTLLSYVAFRVACRFTLERFSWAKQLDREFDEPLGYLVEVPFLREVPAPVQLELLASCWRRHTSGDRFELDLVDEAVLYAACELTARLAETEPQLLARYLRGGPFDLGVPIDAQLAAEVRRLFLNLASEGDFLIVGQLLDLPPDEVESTYQRLRIPTGRFEPLFDLLGRWFVPGDYLLQFQNLLTPAEQQTALELLRPHCVA